MVSQEPLGTPAPAHMPPVSRRSTIADEPPPSSRIAVSLPNAAEQVLNLVGCVAAALEDVHLVFVPGVGQRGAGRLGPGSFIWPVSPGASSPSPLTATNRVPWSSRPWMTGVAAS